jgi:hypothetical protein
MRRLENGNMLELLKSMLTGQNAFASGGLLLMIIGGLSVYLRAVPERLWHWIVGQTTMIITVKDDDAAFVWVKEWFLLENDGRIFNGFYLEMWNRKVNDRKRVRHFRECASLRRHGCQPAC